MKRNAGIGVLTFAMLNVAAVLSIVNYPEQANYGYACLFIIAAGAICFFIPCALVSAEMASALPHAGGLYLWGKTAFNEKIGFLTVALQWFNGLPWYGTVLTFIATTLAYMTKPELAKNSWFVYAIILAVTWSCTAINCRGITLYAKLGSWGAVIGTLLPTAIIVAGAVIWLVKIDSPAIPFDSRELLPSFNNLDDWMLLAGMMVALAGIDMTALHITDLRNPRRNYPLAILISSLVIILTSAAGALAIAVVVPPLELSMASGAGEAFSRMFDLLGISFLTPVVCLMLALGAITTVFTWLLGPSRGVYQIAREGLLPRFWAKANDKGIPVRILVLQATIISTISLVVFVMPTIGGAFWVFMALSSQLYMLMYISMFCMAIGLRIRHPELPRPFRIPGGLSGVIAVCGLGILTSVTAFFSGLIPPSAIRERGIWHMVLYTGAICLGTGFFVSVPLLILRRAAKRAQSTEKSAKYQ